MRQQMNEGVEFIRDLMVILVSASAGGWLAGKLKLPSVVGYLAAGLIIGTPEITFIYVTDTERVRVLSQIGLVLLMFAIGTGIRIQTLKKLGIGPVVATVLTALLMVTIGRSGGFLIGLNSLESLFFASMLMVSSSAIIGKILTERHMLHQRVGQLALSQTLLEDFVAVVMLGVLGSAAAASHMDGGSTGIMSSMAKLGGFVILVFLTGLVLLPRAMNRVRSKGGEEMHIILTGGLVFGFAFLSVKAGYSLALGAFLFGMLVAGSAHNRSVVQAFSGMRDIFAAIFFVAVGMETNLALMPEAVDLIVLGVVLAIIGRILSATLGWLAACESAAVSAKTALFLTPIGEFSFIIAGLGVSSGVLPERFQVAAIGIAFISSLVAPILMGRSEKLMERAGFTGMRDSPEWLQIYRGLFQRVGRIGSNNDLWKLLSKRLWQIGRELAWIAALGLFSNPLYMELVRLATDTNQNFLLVNIVPWFWLLILLLLLVPLVSIIRNIQAASMLLIDFYSRSSSTMDKFRRPLTILLQAIGMGSLLLILVNVMPWWRLDIQTAAPVLLIAVGVMILGWKRLIRLHSVAENRIMEAIEEGPDGSVPEDWRKTGQTWGVVMEEYVIPEDFAYIGRTISEINFRQRTGATIVGIERQGVYLDQPGPEAHLFPGDKLFFIGQAQDIEKARVILTESKEKRLLGDRDFTHAILEPVLIPQQTPLAGMRLSELNWPRLLGVQVVAVKADGKVTLSPSADWKIIGGSELLLAGDPKAIQEVKNRLSQNGSV